MTDYVTSTADAPMGRTGAIKLFDEPSFEGMRRAERLAAEVLDMLVPHVVPGVETQALDEMIRDHIVRAGAVPATLGYRGYTPSSCTSLNHYRTRVVYGNGVSVRFGPGGLRNSKNTITQT